MAKHFSNGQGRPRIPISNKHVESVHLDMWINWVSYDFSFSFWRSCYLRATRDSPRKNEMGNVHLSKHDRNVSNDNWLRWVSIESYILHLLHFILRPTNPVYYIYIRQKWGQIPVQYLQQLQWRMWYSAKKECTISTKDMCHPTYTDKNMQVASSTCYVSAVPLCQGAFWKTPSFEEVPNLQGGSSVVSTSKKLPTLSFSLFTGPKHLRWLHDSQQLHLNKGIRQQVRQKQFSTFEIPGPKKAQEKWENLWKLF